MRNASTTPQAQQAVQTAQAHYAQAVALTGTGQHAQALQHYAQALAHDPSSHLAWANQGVVLALLGHYEQALASFDQALARAPQLVEAWTYKATTLVHLKRYAEALPCCDQALALRPGHADTWCNRGNALSHLGQHEASMAAYQQAIACDPQSALAWSNLGQALTHLQRTEEALACFDKALSLKPDYAQAWYNRGNALHAQEQGEQACEAYDQALALDANYAETHWNKSLALLRMGRLSEGWRGYEWRKKVDKAGWAQREFSQAAWDGRQDIAGKTVLLHFEQGFGDTLQFCRYAAMVAAKGAKVILEVQAALLPLLQSLEGPEQVIASGQALPPFDLHCALLSLPLALGTTLETIPASIPYLHPDPALVAHWRSRLATDPPHPKVGLVWSGSPTHNNDKHRSLPLEQLLPALSNLFTHCQMVSLQKELRPQDEHLLAAQPAILHFGQALRDYADTAALCSLMDVVVTVDTSVAHLAGALGRPVLLLLPANPDWRWMSERPDSPWYPTMTLLRQTQLGQWGPVLEQLPALLDRVIAAHT